MNNYSTSHMFYDFQAIHDWARGIAACEERCCGTKVTEYSAGTQLIFFFSKFTL